jgi:molybdopterin/thiamine biosynthesis adenylyltransferase/rhodanese-related sulfurtransferase
MTFSSLTGAESQRYSRHLLLPEIGVEGQLRLRASSVLCVGMGGLGSPVAMYLAAAGVGRLGLVDADRVDLTNLQRQLLHGTPDIGRAKTESAFETLTKLNPEVKVEMDSTRLTSQNAMGVISRYDLVVDCTDNFPARFLINDACFFLKRPLVYGAIYRFTGQASLFAPHLGGPCYRCLYPEPPAPGVAPSCADAGVLGVLPGIIGCIQATEALKSLLGCGVSLMGRLLLLDALEMKFRELKLTQDPACPLCGRNPSILQLTDLPETCSMSQSHPQRSPASAVADEMTVEQLKAALESNVQGAILLDVREPAEYQIARIPGSRLIPLGTLPQQASGLDPNATYYVHCRSGMRSRQAVDYLKSQGFSKVWNVTGGILAWSEQIDPKVPKY